MFTVICNVLDARCNLEMETKLCPSHRKSGGRDKKL